VKIEQHNPTHLVAHLQFFQPHKTKQKNAKELPSQRTTTRQWTEKEERRHNITYTQAGVSCFVRQENAVFEVQFFVGISVVKIPACV